MTAAVSPSGWPAGVRPPDAPDWEATAVAWLLDRCPPEYRGYSGLRRYPVVLARFAALHVEGMQDAGRRGVSEARTALRDVAEPEVVERAVATWQLESERLARLRREVELVEEALRGRRFRRRL
ncbi:MAG: hypothetical protein M3353_00885 [Actinomycetota bacterium]|nr:hypothetical protein [Actinomycetota bacterium]